MTTSLFLIDTYLYKSTARVAANNRDERGIYVVLDQTIFYPQGGGQPSDQGVLKCDDTENHVLHVKQVDGEIRHYVSTLPNVPVGTHVIAQIDQERRILNAQYHTAAHLIGNIAEQICPALKAVKGHSFPGEAYVEFQGSEIPDAKMLAELLNKAISDCLLIKTFEATSEEFEKQFYKLPYAVPSNKMFRAMQIADYPPVPCGGTHLSNCSEISYIEIGKVKAKNDTFRISYEVK